jgi:hypothetical protein
MTDSHHPELDQDTVDTRFAELAEGFGADHSPPVFNVTDGQVVNPHGDVTLLLAMLVELYGALIADRTRRAGGTAYLDDPLAQLAFEQRFDADADRVELHTRCRRLLTADRWSADDVDALTAVLAAVRGVVWSRHPAAIGEPLLVVCAVLIDELCATIDGA